VHLQLFLACCEVSVAQLCVIVFVGHLTKQVDAMKLMEDLKANSVTLYTRLWMDCSEVSFGHANYIELFIRNDLVTDCRILVLKSVGCMGFYSLSYEIACHALSTSGPEPTYGDPSPIVLLNLTLLYSTAFAAGATQMSEKWHLASKGITHNRLRIASRVAKLSLV